MGMVADEPHNAVFVEEDGSITVKPEAQRRLAAAAGRYRVVPTAADILILQRSEPTNPEHSSSGLPTGKVAMAGDIESVGGLIDVIHFMQGNAWSGQLAVIDGTVRKTVHFRRGEIRSASSNVAEDRLGAILYRFGVVGEKTLQTALSSSSASKLGQTLVASGALTAHELYTYVRRQIEEIFFSLLTLKRGAFYVYRTPDDVGPPSQLSLSTKALLFEGVRRIDELSYFRAKLPGPDVVLVRREPPPPDPLGPREQRVLGLVDGVHDLGAIARTSHLGEFDTTKTLFQLLQAGFVQVRPATTALQVRTIEAGKSVDDVHTRVIETFNGVFARIYVAVQQKGLASSLLDGMRSFFSSTAEFAPLFVGIGPKHDGTLPREALSANLEFSPTQDKVDYLHRGLSELLSFMLFTAGEAVDRLEAFELQHQLESILHGDDDLEITIERETA